MKNDKQFTAVEDEMTKLAEKMANVSGYRLQRNRLQYNTPPTYSITKRQTSEEEYKQHGWEVPFQSGLTLQQAITTLTQLYFDQLAKIEAMDKELATLYVEVRKPENKKNYELLAKWSTMQDTRDALSFGTSLEYFRSQREGKRDESRCRRMEREMMNM